MFVLSVDDKAKVPIGVTAATKQSPLVMHVSYEIRLPDHDIVKATKHKLTPSVYAGCEIRSPSSRGDPEISYSGPTYVAIRSGKHDSSTAYSHGKDFNHVMEMKEFEDLVKIGDVTKPIAIIPCDGGPDENPRFPKTPDVSIQHFQELNFDVMFLSTRAPGMSAYNNVERRMAPLSKALSGVLLPHETFGSHLDSQRRTADVELEKKNFKAAGNILAEIWSEHVLDKFPVVRENVVGVTMEPVPINEAWVTKHCRILQYFLQIVKRKQWECCGDFRTSWLRLFPERFLPASIPIRPPCEGPVVPTIKDTLPTDCFPCLWIRKIADPLVPERKYSVLPYNS